MDYYEVSIKVTSSDVNYDRYSFGFEPKKIDNVDTYIISFIGLERYDEFLKHFRREIHEPQDDETIMIGWDGKDFEMYVERYGSGKSYDLGKKMFFRYEIIDYRFYRGIYESLRVLPEIVYAAIPQNAKYIFARESPKHKCVFLFRYDGGIELSDELKNAARFINPDVVFDIKNRVYVIAVGITKDDEPELAIYFR